MEEARLHVISGVLLGEILLVLRQVVGGEDGVRRAHGNASAAVKAFVLVNVDLGDFFGLGLIPLGMDAVGGTGIGAKEILQAGIDNNMGHCRFSR
jgi:hypothetical protein